MKKILNISKKWTPDSWRGMPIKQSPNWPIKDLRENIKKLSSFPPLVPVHEIENLKNQFNQVADQRAFILIAGDCAETFSDFNQTLIEKKLQMIFQMSLIITCSLKKPIIKIGRLAGQFAKPRSFKNEKKGKICLPSYMGDAVNGKEFSYQSRIPQPKRLVKAYYHSATTLNLLRSLTEKNIYEMIEKEDEKFFESKSFNKKNDISIIKKPIIKIGRLAGQFAKPRSFKNEKRGKICLPSYMGDAVNGKEFSYQSRIPQPKRLVKAYYHSATTLNLLRSLTEKNIYEMIEKEDEKFFESKSFNKKNDISIIKKPIIKIGRLAGQFAKPRSFKNEKRGKICLPSYMGDAVNGKEFSYQSRIPQPKRLVKAYYHSATTLNLLRSLTEKNIYEMIEKEDEKNFESKSFNKKNDISAIKKALHLTKSISKKAEYNHIFSEDFFTAHEALLLDYEQALTKKENNKWYDCSSHLVWLGYRTGQPDHAHVEFLSGIENPIGIKIGKETCLNDLVIIINKLNPNNKKGKIVLMVRYGTEKINSYLKELIDKISINNFNVLWICDPMHGNTYKTKDGYKTRDFEDIKLELKSFFNILNSKNIYPSGVHFELTPEDVTECISDSYNIKQSNMHEKYQTACDPRLNKDQSLDIAFSINELLKE